MGGRLIQLVASNVWGGAERCALDLCRHFSGLGWSVTAYTRDAAAVDSRFSAYRIDLRHAPLAGAFDPFTIAELASHLRGEMQGAIVHAHRYRDAFAAAIARRIACRRDIRIVVTRHTVACARHPRLLRRLYSEIDGHVFVSRLARQSFEAPFAGEKVLRGPVEIIHDGLNVEAAAPLPEPEKGPVVAQYMGRIMPGKGLETLIDALPRLRGKRTRLRIVGGGNPDYIDSLRRRAFARGVSDMIDWYKFTSETLPLVASSHFGVTPSVAAEAFGLVNVEFMAAGRPVITTLNGAQPEYITDGEEGLLVAPASAQALADAMERLATDAVLRRRMGEAAFRRWEGELSWPGVAQAMEKLYLSV